MLISDQVQKLIDAIINDRFNTLFVYLAGRESIPSDDLKRLKEMGWITKEPDEEENLIEDIYLANRLPSKDLPDGLDYDKLKLLRERLSPRERYAIKLAQDRIVAGLAQHQAAVKNAISNLVLSGNYDYRNAGAMKTALEEGLLKKEMATKLASQLRDKTGDLYRDWRRVAITEVTNTMNMGLADRIVADNKDRKPDEIYVYKTVIMDSRLCKECKRLYLESDGITPKVFTMAELQANGTNVGLKPAEWKATIGATHPHCRGSLLELPPGWGFAEGTRTLQYVGPDFNWYENRKS